MGLLIWIHRADYDSVRNVFHGCAKITLVDADGPFDPSPDAPAATLATSPYGDPIIIPLDWPPDRPAGPSFGGTFAATSDSRFGAAVVKATGIRTGRHGYYAAVPIHDRFDTWDDFDRLTR
jgi:hypothetical protein